MFSPPENRACRLDIPDPEHPETLILDQNLLHRNPDAMTQSVDEKKLGKRLRRETGRAIQDFQMIGEGDRVMVCASGGKDSFILLDVLEQLRHRAPISFSLRAVPESQRPNPTSNTI